MWLDWILVSQHLWYSLLTPAAYPSLFATNTAVQHRLRAYRASPAAPRTTCRLPRRLTATGARASTALCGAHRACLPAAARHRSRSAFCVLPCTYAPLAPSSAHTACFACLLYLPLPVPHLHACRTPHGLYAPTPACALPCDCRALRVAHTSDRKRLCDAHVLATRMAGKRGACGRAA